MGTSKTSFVKGSKETSRKEASEDKEQHIQALIADMPRQKRSDLIDSLLETYCTMCAAKLEEDGECPDGCDPEDLLGEDDEDDEEGDDGDPDEEDEDENEEETEPNA